MPRITFASLLVGLFLCVMSASALAADRVEKVKHLGKVNFRDFQCKEAKDKYVHELCYAKKTRTLIVKLDKKFHGYCGVPKSVYADWRKSTHKKVYFENKVKGKYACS